MANGQTQDGQALPVVVVYLIYKVSTMEDDAAASARDLINSQSHGTTIGFNLLRIFLTSFFLSMSLLLL